MSEAKVWDPSRPGGGITDGGRNGQPGPTPITADATGALVGTIRTSQLSAIKSLGGLRRKKVASIGTSLNVRNQTPSSSGAPGSYDAWGFINQLYALSNGGFDRITSTATTWTTNPITGGANVSGQSESIDAFGAYGAGGANSTQILLRMPQVIAAWTQVPDVVVIGALFTNDQGNGMASATSISNAKAVLTLIQRAAPNALIILSSPDANDSHNTTAKQQAMREVRDWVMALNVPNVLTELNNSLMIDVNTGQMVAAYASDGGAQGTTNVHPNELGALIHARSYLDQFPGLFDAPLVIPQAWAARTASDTTAESAGNVTGAVGQVCSVNPVVKRLGAPGATINGVQVLSYNWYPDTGVGVQLGQTADGIRVDLWKGAGFAGGGATPTTDSVAFPLSNQLAGVFQAHFRVRILNPTGILSLRPLVLLSGGTPQTIEANFTQGGFTTGIAAGLRAGDVLCFSTAPFTLTGGNNQVEYCSMKCHMLASLPTETGYAGNSPSFEILAITPVRVA